MARATAFYQAIGFEQNPDFSNDVASAMRWSDAISVMLLDHGFYATFTDKPIADTHQVSAALFCLSFDDRAAVDAIHETAGPDTKITKSPDAPLFGAGGSLASFDLVMFVIEVEERIAAATGKAIRLSTPAAMSRRNSPFRTLGALAEYIDELVKEAA